MEENEIFITDVPETSEEEQIETNTSEEVEEVQAEESAQTNEEDIERQIEERSIEKANKLFEEKIEARLARDRVKREREEAKKNAKYQELETIMKSALGADNIDDVITKSRAFYKEQGISIPEVVNNSSLNERDEIVLAKADAGDIIKLGKSEMESEANRIAAIPEAKRTIREKTIFNDLCQELVRMNDLEDLKAKGYDLEILGNKDFETFRNQFTLNTPISQIYEMYQKVNGTSPIQPKSPGSAKTKTTNNEIREDYTIEEVSKFTDEDYDNNPGLYQAVRKSMLKWKTR